MPAHLCLHLRRSLQQAPVQFIARRVATNPRLEVVQEFVEKLLPVYEFPELVPSDDVWQRISDFTFDIGEYQRVRRERVLAVRERAHALGDATIASSVHLHVSLDRADQASASTQLMSLLYGVDPFRVLSSYAFIGDSEWQTLRAKPGYTDPEIVLNITSIILRPTPYSQI